MYFTTPNFRANVYWGFKETNASSHMPYRVDSYEPAETEHSGWMNVKKKTAKRESIILVHGTGPVSDIVFPMLAALFGGEGQE